MEVQLAVREISAPVSICSSGYSLFWLKRGECAVQTPKGCFEAGCGDAFLLQPDGLYTISPKTEARLYRVDFHREAFLRACLPALKGCPLLVSFFVHNSVRSDMAFLHFHGVSPEIGALLCTMNREFEEKGAYYQTILLCSLINLLLQLSRNCRIDTTANEPPAGQLLQRLMEYLVSHADSVTLGGMAEAFHYHPNTIAAVLKKGTGKNFSQLVQQTRMSNAAQLLRYSRLPAEEIAARCGYGNISYFYTRFHQYFGMTPGEYVERSREREREEMRKLS